MKIKFNIQTPVLTVKDRESDSGRIDKSEVVGRDASTASAVISQLSLDSSGAVQLVAILTYSWSQGEDTDQHLLHHPDNWILMDHLHLHTWNNPATILYFLISDHYRWKWFNHGKVLKAIEDDLHFEYLQ